MLALGVLPSRKALEDAPCMCPRAGAKLQTRGASVPLEGTLPRRSCQPASCWNTAPWHFHPRLPVTPEHLQESRRLGKEDVRPQRVLLVPHRSAGRGPSPPHELERMQRLSLNTAEHVPIRPTREELPLVHGPWPRLGVSCVNQPRGSETTDRFCLEMRPDRWASAPQSPGGKKDRPREQHQSQNQSEAPAAGGGPAPSGEGEQEGCLPGQRPRLQGAAPRIVGTPGQALQETQGAFLGQKGTLFLSPSVIRIYSVSQ